MSVSAVENSNNSDVLGRSGGRAALLGRAAAVPGQPAALRHGGGAARAVRALRARGRAARAQQARRARRAPPPQLRVHHLRDLAGRARLPQRRRQYTHLLLHYHAIYYKN